MRVWAKKDNGFNQATTLSIVFIGCPNKGNKVNTKICPLVAPEDINFNGNYNKKKLGGKEEKNKNFRFELKTSFI